MTAFGTSFRMCICIWKYLHEKWKVIDFLRKTFPYNPRYSKKNILFLMLFPFVDHSEISAKQDIFNMNHYLTNSNESIFPNLMVI